MSLILLAAGLAASAQQAEPAPLAPATIDWEVKDRFRLFDEADEAARRRVEHAMRDIAGTPLDETLSALHASLLDLLSGDAAASLRRSHYDPERKHGNKATSGRYDQGYLYPEKYRVEVSARNLPAGAVCLWRVNDEPPVSGCGPTILGLPATPRGETAGARATVTLTIGGATSMEVREKIVVEDRLVVAMGDSYISGEGNPDVPAQWHTSGAVAPGRFHGSDWAAKIRADRFDREGNLTKAGDVRRADWWDRQCHRSLLSWPVLATFVHAARNPRQAMTLVHLGCSGDEVNDGLLAARHDLPGGGREDQSQIVMLTDLLGPGASRKVDRLLLSVGGNDIGFSGVVAGLLLPPQGYRLGKPIVKIAAGAGNVVCSYRIVDEPIARLCGKETGVVPARAWKDRRSAQTRLDELPGRLDLLAAALSAKANVDSASVFHAIYPNVLLDENKEVCRTARSADDIKDITDPVRKEAEKDYSRDHPLRIRAGFEGLKGSFPWYARGRQEWAFMLIHRPDTFAQNVPMIEDFAAAGCNIATDSSDSEVCQSAWVWSELNSKLRSGQRGWRVMDSFAPAIRTKGWCNATDVAPLRLPSALNGAWLEPRPGYPDVWSPDRFKPYAVDLPRWFRTTNDSLLTQFAGPRNFHHGTIHPTYHTHLAIARTALRDALGE